MHPSALKAQRTKAERYGDGYAISAKDALTQWIWIGGTRQVHVRVCKFTGIYAELKPSGHYEICADITGETLCAGVSPTSGYKRNIRTAKSDVTRALRSTAEHRQFGTKLA